MHKNIIALEAFSR